MTGAWLHSACSTCTAVVHDQSFTLINRQTGAVTITYPYRYCTSPGNRWDAGCVQAAQAYCAASQRMAPHSECTTGAGIGKYASGCALTVELINGDEDCAMAWDSHCVDAANRHCTSGLESPIQIGRPGVGFCGTQPPPNDGG
jgi:hypothetical protein